MKKTPVTLLDLKTGHYSLTSRFLQGCALLLYCNFAYADEGILNGEFTSPAQVLPRVEIVHEQGAPPTLLAASS